MRIPLLLLAGILLLGCRQNKESATAALALPHMISVDSTRGLAFEVLDSAFTQLVDTEGAIAVIAQGFTWSEGPVWVNSDEGGFLLFEDIPGNVTYRWRSDSSALTTPESDKVEGVDTMFYPSGYFANPSIEGEPGANGLLLDKEGRLLMARHGERDLARYRGDISDANHDYKTASRPDQFKILSSAYQGKQFNSPNDLIQLENGDIIFTDPTYGVDKTFGAQARELDFAGVFRRNAYDSTVQLIYRELPRPNGIALTPNERSFIVGNSESANPHWIICDVPAMGEAALACETFADASHLVGTGNPGTADGMVMHPSGVLFATGPGGVLCFSESGKHLGTIRTGRPTGNVTIGGEAGKTLFITADNLVLRVELL